jgi:hypothetical protein
MNQKFKDSFCIILKKKKKKKKKRERKRKKKKKKERKKVDKLFNYHAICNILQNFYLK